LNKTNLNINIKLTKFLSIFGGPSFNVYYSDQPSAIKDYKFNLPPQNYKLIDLNNNKLKGWIGWNAGINIF
jgi:hypothetical protein